jgi:serine protease
MRKILLSAFIALIGLVAGAQDQVPRIHGDVLASLFSNDEMPKLRADFQSQFGVELRHLGELFPALRIHHFSYDYTNLNEAEVLRWFKRQDAVDAAQFNAIAEERATVPNDPLYNNQWWHTKIQSPAAWDITTGGQTMSGDDIVVCVVESGGAQYTHVDLIGNHWTNPFETAGNGVDDDGNGYIDDFNGWNTPNNNGNVPTGASSGHGTSVSGMIGAKGNNSVGISGVNWNVKIMQVRVGSLTQSNVIAAYNYPYTMRVLYNENPGTKGAFVVAVNSSWGIDNANPANYPLWCAMYDTMGEAGILNCGATANNNVNIDNVGDMPTACPSPYLISVTATNSNDVRTFSGFGITHVDLGAPGESVYTTNNNNGYGNNTGTSFASPLVAGAVGLLYSAPCSGLGPLALSEPAVAAALVRDAIFETVDETTQLLTQTSTGGRINVFQALNWLMTACPSSACFTPAQVMAANIGGNTATLTWASSSSAESYDLEFRMEGQGDDDWVLFEDLLVNALAMDSLMWCTGYEFRVRAYCGLMEDDEGNLVDTYSEWSDIYSFTTDGCCTAPAGLNVSVSGNGQNINVTWSALLAAESYTVSVTVDGVTTEIETTSTSLTITDLLSCENYTISVAAICVSGEVQSTSSATVTTPGCGACNDLAYCASGGEVFNEEWIQSITIAGVNNNSGMGDSGYQDFTGTVIPMQTAVAYPITLVPGFNGGPFSEHWQVWIDLNQNGVFSNNEKLYVTAAATSQTINSTLTIPVSGTLPGITRMRIVMNYGGQNTLMAASCGTYSYGETEDYCVEISVVPGVESLEDFVQFNVFPNPAQGNVTLVHNNKSGRASVVVRNVLGAEVLTIALPSPMTQLSLDGIAPGAYTISLLNADGQSIAIQKLIVE